MAWDALASELNCVDAIDVSMNCGNKGYIWSRITQRGHLEA